MDFQPDSGLDDFRQEVREFLRDNLPGDLAGKYCSSIRSALPDLVRWQRILNTRGWGAPYWPKEHGGTGWSVLQRLVFDEECAAAGTPTLDGFAHKLLGPVINHFASAEQKAAHLPGIFQAERLWCQGFSEPGSGSDLASLRTRAELDGEHYVVNGQKIWTSYAHEADWIFLLVRTDASARKQAGISFLLVDMRTPGITVRPIHSIDGCHHLNETFFDNVRVPVSNRIGAEGDGWKITKFLLNNEHATAADLPILRRYVQQLRRLGRELPVGSGRLGDQGGFALKLSQMEAEVDAIAMLVKRVAALEQAGDHSPKAHALGSILKVSGTELQQRLTQFMVESLGDYGAIAYATPEAADPTATPLPHQDLARGMAMEMLFRRASTIYGGTSEVQRSIIAKTLFQL